jgi:hypothetical protein
VATSGEPVLFILSQDTLQTAAGKSTRAIFDPAACRLTGLTPFSYAAGALPMISDEKVSANVLMGTFGTELALLQEAIDRQNTFGLAGSDNLTAQSIIYALTHEPLIGEEIFATGAYLKQDRFRSASLVAQDGLRWLIIAVILVGALLALLGVV